MEKDTARLAGYDGRLGDLGKAESWHFMPWISDSWRSHFKWRGKGGLSAREQAKLAHIVKSAHANGQKNTLLGRAGHPRCMGGVSQSRCRFHQH
jgi:hypothetical protein